jgi:thiosulfate dehydrogenase
MDARFMIAVVGLALVQGGPVLAEDPAEAAASPSGGAIVVELCDGETATSVPVDLPRTPENGRRIAGALMAEWRAKHPEQTWITAAKSSSPTGGPAAPQPMSPAEPDGSSKAAAAGGTADIVAVERGKHTIMDPHDNSDLVGRGQGATYGQITETDVALWQRETLKFVAEGSRVFHSADALGSTIAVSCDMCHPDAANTHAETYPKYQVQLGRVALLRDMINWCIEHPVRGQKLAEDDPRMRALEAYIYAQRSGTPLSYGKR